MIKRSRIISFLSCPEDMLCIVSPSDTMLSTFILGFKEPHHPYTVGLLNSIPDFHENKEKLNAIPGMVPSPDNFPTGCRFQDRCPLVIDKCRTDEPPLEEIANAHKAACWRASEVKLEN